MGSNYIFSYVIGNDFIVLSRPKYKTRLKKTFNK